MRTSTPDEFSRLTTLEVCAMLNIGRTRLYTMLSTGALPAPIKDGHRNYWPLLVIRKFIRDQWNDRFGGGEQI
jgi:predicted DNA-binding transcriptional regulator AlpA